MRERTVILTGPPRSGTTLVCHLLNRIDDVVALHEPVPLSRLRQTPFGRTLLPRRLVDRLEHELDKSRRSLLRDSVAVCKQHEGAVPDNPIGEAGGVGGSRWQTRMTRLSRWLRGARPLRRGQVERGLIRVEGPLSPDFLLCSKHPSLYTALLEELVPRYRVYAVVRNPLATLGSWNSMEYAVSRGRARAAERLHPQLAARLDATDNLAERQLALLDWFFTRLRDLVPADRVLRYEETIASGGANLGALVGREIAPDPELRSQNTNKRYDRDLTLRLGERLLEMGGAWTSFYPAESVEGLMAAYEDGAPEADG